MDIVRHGSRFPNIIQNFRSIYFIQYRSVSYFSKKKLTDCNLALESFDVAYGNSYGSHWPSIRLALLCKKKYIAIINNCAPNYKEHMHKFKELGCMDVGERYKANCAAINMEQLTSQTQILPEKSKKQSDRLPVREMTDDQLASLASQPPPEKYPERYRLMTNAPTEPPGGNRLLLPQPGIDNDVSQLQDYIPSQNMKGIDVLSEEEDIFKKFQEDTASGIGPDVSVEVATSLLQWPEMLSVMTFPRADITTFPKPAWDNGLYDHFALDGASILPVLLLGMQPGDSVLDMCAAPGGKTLAILQTYLTGLLQSNDSSFSRARRIESIVKQYYGSESSLLNTHRVTQGDGRHLNGTYSSFDRVLVDVPCLTDRHSLNEPDNNIFKKSRLKERLAMPELQCELLMEAVKQVRVGGTVVYSTCSLSPLQNDGVVHLTINRLWDNTNIEVKVVKYETVLEPLNFLFKFGDEDLGLRYGQIILPFLPNNYGPMYCAKLVRTK